MWKWRRDRVRKHLVLDLREDTSNPQENRLERVDFQRGILSLHTKRRKEHLPYILMLSEQSGDFSESFVVYIYYLLTKFFSIGYSKIITSSKGGLPKT